MKSTYKFLAFGICLFLISCGSDDDGNNNSGVQFLGYTWNSFNSSVFSHSQEGSVLELELTQNAVWLNGSQGGMFHTLINGDFDFYATVRTTKRSDTASPPDDGFSFGGLIVRDPNTSAQNYVHLVAGTGDTGEAVPYGYEYKFTSDSSSDYQIIYDGVSEYDLRIVRSGDMFTLYHRPAGSGGASEWQEIISQSLELSAEVQLGFSIYTGSVGDLSDVKTTFSGITIETE